MRFVGISRAELRRWRANNVIPFRYNKLPITSLILLKAFMQPLKAVELLLEVLGKLKHFGN